MIWGADLLGPISTKIGKVVGVHDLINHTKFGFNIFRGFRSTGGQNFRFPIDFAGHRYNSAAATAQPVMTWLGLVRVSHSCQILSVDGACLSLATFVVPTPIKTILELFRPASGVLSKIGVQNRQTETNLVENG